MTVRVIHKILRRSVPSNVELAVGPVGTGGSFPGENRPGHEGKDSSFNKMQLNSKLPRSTWTLYAAALRTVGYGPSTAGGLYMQL